MTDCKTSMVVVKGVKADPLKVLERVQRKSHRQVELLSPIPKPKAEEEKKPEEKETPKPVEKKEEVFTFFCFSPRKHNCQLIFQIFVCFFSIRESFGVLVFIILSCVTAASGYNRGAEGSHAL